MQKGFQLTDTSLKSKNFSSGPIKSIFTGIVISLSNPYWFIWWITVGLVYLSIALPEGIWGVAAFFIGHISADFLWYSIVSFFVARGIKPVNHKAFLFLVRFCGLFLAGFGFFLIMDAVI